MLSYSMPTMSGFVPGKNATPEIHMPTTPALGGIGMVTLLEAGIPYVPFASFRIGCADDERVPGATWMVTAYGCAGFPNDAGVTSFTITITASAGPDTSMPLPIETTRWIALPLTMNWMVALAANPILFAGA